MKQKTFGFIALTAMFAAPVLAAEPAPSSPEAQLQTILDGYTPGPAQRCLATSRIRKLKIIDRTAMVASHGGTLYVNRPVNPAALRHDLVPAFEPDASRICSGAPVSLHSSADFFNVGAVRLQEWVPYRRSDKD